MWTPDPLGVTLTHVGIIFGGCLIFVLLLWWGYTQLSHRRRRGNWVRQPSEHLCQPPPMLFHRVDAQWQCNDCGDTWRIHRVSYGRRGNSPTRTMRGWQMVVDQHITRQGETGL